MAFAGASAYAATAEELEMKSLGTTENINPVVAKSFKRAAAGPHAGAARAGAEVLEGHRSARPATAT